METVGEEIDAIEKTIGKEIGAAEGPDDVKKERDTQIAERCEDRELKRWSGSQSKSHHHGNETKWEVSLRRKYLILLLWACKP
ncbi:hypothetical protein LWI29_037415 [Acer saccharum]|uniref:Uncharacterized protein n=1 Tax=Acer saccharum TaxID=4024 RepID=A0AA39W3U4_ACESA|nr:hypothetical protein LWI29_037415 [Acer saccharum]